MEIKFFGQFWPFFWALWTFFGLFGRDGVSFYFYFLYSLHYKMEDLCKPSKAFFHLFIDMLFSKMEICPKNQSFLHVYHKKMSFTLVFNFCDASLVSNVVLHSFAQASSTRRFLWSIAAGIWWRMDMLAAVSCTACPCLIFE